MRPGLGGVLSMRMAIIVFAAATLAATLAQARTVVRMDPAGVKTITMDTPRGVVVIRCDRANKVLSQTGPTAGMDLVDICRRN